MSHHQKSSAVPKRHPDDTEAHQIEIIPWPDVNDILEEVPEKKSSRVRLTQKFLYYKGRQIPILQFQKAGSEKLLKLLVKEMSR